MYGARLGLVSGAHTKKRAALGMETPKTALAYQKPLYWKGVDSRGYLTSQRTQ